MAATTNYRVEMDTLGAFINECCELEPSAKVLTGDLYTAYTEWCTDNRDAPGRAAFLARFEREVDPDGSLAESDPPISRQPIFRAESAPTCMRDWHGSTAIGDE